MKISNYLVGILKDFFTAFGFLIAITSIFWGLYAVETIESALIWQMIPLALSLTFFKYAFVNKYHLVKKAQLINFSICSLLASIMIILWLFLFSPGRIMDQNLAILYIIIIFIVMGAAHAMMYADGHKQAEQLNKKLHEYQNTSEVVK